MINEKEHIHVLLKNALKAIDVADIQSARDLINNACMALEGWKQEEWEWGKWLHDDDAKMPAHSNDALLKEFEW